MGCLTDWQDWVHKKPICVENKRFKISAIIRSFGAISMSVWRQKDAAKCQGPITHSFVFHFTLNNFAHEVCKDWKGCFFSFVRNILECTWLLGCALKCDCVANPDLVTFSQMQGLSEGSSWGQRIIWTYWSAARCSACCPASWKGWFCKYLRSNWSNK